MEQRNTMERRITEEMIEEYRNYLYEEEKSRATIEKYLCDLKKLIGYANGQTLTKSLMLNYKEKLYREDRYKINSVNSYLVAANRFFEYMQWYELRVKTYRVQKEIFCTEEKYLSKAEYKRLLRQAREEKKIRLYMILETLAATGMRVSEIQFLTVSAVRRGTVEINNKGKVRTVLLSTQLQKQLLLYLVDARIHSGVVFRTKRGKAVDRSNIWREMKELCQKADVLPDKVFPHNLRHLFARCFYQIKKDIAKLANVLGHNNIETTRLYIRTTPKEHRKQLEMLDLLEVLWETT
ncbi:MAG: site-specific integrase [Ruminococcus sp.]|nr:site-specific integrase [Ruminococcus sp.]